MNPLFFLILLFAQQETKAREVTFSWEPFEKVLGYQLEVSDSPKFEKDPAVKKSVKKPTYTTDLPMGTYYYRVRALDLQKHAGHWSEPEKVIVTPYPPELTIPKNIAEFSFFEVFPKIEFTWKPTEGEPIYEIFIYKTTGKKILEHKATATQFSITTLPEGEYMWKVRTIYKNIYFSPYCEPRRFTIEKKPLAEPKLISPVQEANLPSYRAVHFTWEKDPSSHFVDLKIDPLSGADKTPHLIENIQDANEFSYYLEQDGKYQWKIVTKENESTKGLSSNTEKFELRKDFLSDGNYSMEFGYGYLTDRFQYTNFRGGGGTGSMTSTALTSHLNGSYFFNMNYGLKLNLSKGTLAASNGVPLHEWTLDNSLRVGAPGFTQEILIGYKQMNLYEFLGGTYNLFTSYGAHVGTLLTGTVAKGWKIKMGAFYYKPLGIAENIGDIKADVYGAELGVGWNLFYKFWLNYQFGYYKQIINFRPDGASLTSKTELASLSPFMLTLSLEH